MTTKTMRSFNPHAKHSPRGGPGSKFKPAEKPMSFDAFKKKKCVLLRSEISTEGYGESEIYYACFLALNPEVWLVKHYGRRTGRVNKRATIKFAMDAEAAYKRYTDEFKAGKYFVKIHNSEMYSDNAIAEAKRLGVLPSLGELKGTELKAPKQHAPVGGLSRRKKTGESEKKQASARASKPTRLPRKTIKGQKGYTLIEKPGMDTLSHHLPRDTGKRNNR